MKYKKTELGQRAFKEHSKDLTAKQRSTFIMIDGKKDVSQLYALLSAVGVSSDDINRLIDLGYIEEETGSDNAAQIAPKLAQAVDTERVSTAPTPAISQEQLTEQVEQERYQKAYLVACKLTAGLGLRGFRMNMAVEGAGSYRDLLEIAPKIREAVGDAKYADLHKALKGL